MVFFHTTKLVSDRLAGNTQINKIIRKKLKLRCMLKYELWQYLKFVVQLHELFQLQLDCVKTYLP